MSDQTPDASKEPTKQWVPLENNPQVLNHLAHTLGLSPAFAFHDVYSLDDPDLLSLIPRPALALILVAPAAVYHAYRATEPSVASAVPEDGSSTTTTTTSSSSSQPIVWFKQTIRNACGTIATLHALINANANTNSSPSSPSASASSSPSPFICPSSPLSSLLSTIHSTTPTPSPTALASLLYHSPALEAAHASAAAMGDTPAPPAEELASELHFICFVKGRDGHLWEVDGNWEGGPLDRGFLGEGDEEGDEEGEDVLSQRALGMGVGRYFETAERLRVEGKGKGEGGELVDGFSVTVLAGRG